MHFEMNKKNQRAAFKIALRKNLLYKQRQAGLVDYNGNELLLLLHMSNFVGSLNEPNKA
jgi:hypothetical protein